MNTLVVSRVIQFEYITSFLHLFRLNVKCVPGRSVSSSSLNLMTAASLKGLPQEIKTLLGCSDNVDFALKNFKVDKLYPVE